MQACTRHRHYRRRSTERRGGPLSCRRDCRESPATSPPGAGSMGRAEIARHAKRETRHATETAPISIGGAR